MSKPSTTTSPSQTPAASKEHKHYRFHWENYKKTHEDFLNDYFGESDMSIKGSFNLKIKDHQFVKFS